MSDESKEPSDDDTLNGLGADCIIILDVRRSSVTKVCYELLWYLNTYNFARGLALSSHSSSPSAVVVE